MKNKKFINRCLSLFTSSAMLFTLASVMPEKNKVAAASDVVIG